jgi:hypothetical protein
VEEARVGLTGCGGSVYNRSEILDQSISSYNYGGNGQFGGIGQLAHAELGKILAAQARAGTN